MNHLHSDRMGKHSTVVRRMIGITRLVHALVRLTTTPYAVFLSLT